MTLPHGLRVCLKRTSRFYRLPFVSATDWGYDEKRRVYQATWGWLNLQLHVPVVGRKEWLRGWGWPDFWGRRASLWCKWWGRRELDHASW